MGVLVCKYINEGVCVCPYMQDCVCERRRVVTLRGRVLRSRKGGRREGKVRREYWVVSKEIDSSVASALIFSCILNVASLSLSLPPSPSLSLSSFRLSPSSCHIHALVIIDLATREFMNLATCYEEEKGERKYYSSKMLNIKVRTNESKID